MKAETKKVLVDPLVDNNPITLQVLGICSALAVTSQMKTSIIMAIALLSLALVLRLVWFETISQAVLGLLFR